MKNDLVDVFSNVQWSTEKVLDQTISLLKRQGVSFQLLPPKTDIDDADALQRVICELKRNGETVGQIDGAHRDMLLCKKIESILAGHGL